MKIIILSTFALLVAALLFSIKTMKNAEISNPEQLEIAHLEKREAQLVAAQLKGQAAGPSLTNTFQASNPLEEAAVKQAELNELERVRAELEELRKSNEVEETPAAEVVVAEEIIPAPAKKERANLVSTALVMARIAEYDEEGKIVGVEILRIGNVNTGDVLGIRRNSGIIGRLKIGMIDRNQGVADPIPSTFMGGKLDIQVGDELILPPAF